MTRRVKACAESTCLDETIHYIPSKNYLMRRIYFIRGKWPFFHWEFLSPCRLQTPGCRQSLHLRCLHLLIHLKSRWQRHLDLCSFRWSATTLRAVWTTSFTFSPVVALFSTYEVPRDLASSQASSSVTVPDLLDLLVWQWRGKGINKNVNFLSRKQHYLIGFLSFVFSLLRWLSLPGWYDCAHA